MQKPYATSGQQSDYNLHQYQSGLSSFYQSNKQTNRSGSNSVAAIKQPVGSIVVSSRQASDKGQELTKIRFKQPITVKKQQVMDSLPQDLKSALQRNLPKFRLNLPTNNHKAHESSSGKTTHDWNTRNTNSRPQSVGQDMLHTFGRQTQGNNQPQIQEMRQTEVSPDPRAKELQKQIEIAFGSEASQRENNQ